MNVYRVSYVENGNEASVNVLAGNGQAAAAHVASIHAKALICGTALLAEDVIKIPLVIPQPPPPQPVIMKKPVSDKVSG